MLFLSKHSYPGVVRIGGRQIAERDPMGLQPTAIGSAAHDAVLDFLVLHNALLEVGREGSPVRTSLANAVSGARNDPLAGTVTSSGGVA